MLLINLIIKHKLEKLRTIAILPWQAKEQNLKLLSSCRFVLICLKNDEETTFKVSPR